MPPPHQRRWVVKLLKGEVAEPPLPPLAQYEETLRQRLRSGSDADDDTAADRSVDAGAAAAAEGWRARRRAQAIGLNTPTSLGPNGSGHWAHQSAGVRPPGW